MPALADHLEGLGVARAQAGRVFGGLHRLRLPIEQIPDLGRHAAVIAAGSWVATAEIVDTLASDDLTEKLVLQLHDGARVESVLVPMKAGRTTLCVSTQVGCAMACTFCATGTLGLTRDLTAGEIVAQVHAAQTYALAQGRRIGRLVYMGMGEPLHNEAGTYDSVTVLMDHHGGPGFGPKAIVISTVGLVPRLRRFSETFGGRVGLALSLHAGTDATRRQIVPAARKNSLADLKAALLDHPLPGSRHLMLEVVVLPGINDTPEELDGIAAFADGLSALVNLIPFNPFPGAPYASPSVDEVRAMLTGLLARGTQVSVRWPKGRGAAGACGQLALRATA